MNITTDGPVHPRVAFKQPYLFSIEGKDVYRNTNSPLDKWHYPILLAWECGESQWVSWKTIRSGTDTRLSPASWGFIHCALQLL